MSKPIQPIRVLVVDDSTFMRNRLSMMLMKCADFQVVGTAMNGEDAIEQAHRTHPDVMTLDVEMPGMNGLEVLDHMMTEHPLPIIMVSVLTEEGAEVTLQALDRGAVDFIAKPRNQALSGIGEMEILLHRKVREAYQSRHRLPSMQRANIPSEGSVQEILAPGKTPVNFMISVGSREKRRHTPLVGDVGSQTEFPLVVVGASTGGPNLLKTIVRDLSPSFSAALLIIQHMPKYFTKVFAENLNALAPIPICEAQNGDELRPGKGFVVPGDHHVTISRQLDGLPRIRFVTDPIEYPYCPSIDCTMVSAAEEFGQSTVGLVLTGMGNDGMVGSQKIKEHGGVVLVQDEATSLIYGMPRAVTEAGMADAVIPDIQVATVLMQTVDSLCGTKA